MPFKIWFHRKALKDLSRIPLKTRKKVIDATAKLPFEGDIRKLHILDAYRLRVGNYRVIYRVDFNRKIVKVIKIKPRGSAYSPLR